MQNIVCKILKKENAVINCGRPQSRMKRIEIYGNRLL